MTTFTESRSAHPASEEAQATARVVLALTIAVGGMTGVIGVATGSTLAVVAVPTALALGLVLAGRATWAAWCGVAAWLLLVPSAEGEAIVAPLAMALLCIAVAIGPERLVSIVTREVAGRSPDNTGPGWIEEDGIRIG